MRGRGDETRVVHEPEVRAILLGVAQDVLHAVRVVDAADVETWIVRQRRECLKDVWVAQEERHEPYRSRALDGADNLMLDALAGRGGEQRKHGGRAHSDGRAVGRGGRGMPVLGLAQFREDRREARYQLG